MHLYEVDATMEDTELLGMAFHGQQYTLPVYGYHALVARRRRDRRLRVPPAGRASCCSRERPPDLWLFKAPHHNFHLEAIVVGLPRRAVRDDAPRSGEVGAVVGEHRVDDLPARRRASATCTDSAARCRTTSGSVWSTPSRRAPASARTASSTSTTAT